MRLTRREQLSEINEQALRESVLKPLLEKMGFQDVFLWHGGGGELGKDIVTWSPNKLGVRRNLAIVAKAGRLSGARAVGEVATQVSQAFNSPYRDPLSGEEQFVHECWVVTSGVMGKEARDGLRSALAPFQSVNVNILDGNEVWRLWGKHFEADLSASIQLAQQHLAEIKSPFKLEVKITEESTQVNILPAVPGTISGEQMEFSGTFEIPDTDEGRLQVSRIEDSFTKGTPVSIKPGEFANFVLPVQLRELFEQVFGALPDASWSMEIGSSSSDVVMPIKVELICDDGKFVGLPYIELKMHHGGTKEMTITNEHQFYPILVRQVVDIESKSFHFTVEKRDGPISPPNLLLWMECCECFSKGCLVQLTHLESGLIFSTGHFPGNDSFDPAYKDLVSEIAFLQKKAQFPIMIPNPPFSSGDLDSLQILHQVMEDREIHGTWTEADLVARGKHGDEAEISDQLSQVEPFNLRIEKDAFLPLFGANIPMGRMSRTVIHPKIVNESEIREILAAAIEETNIVLHLQPRDDDRITETYLDWP